MVIIGSRIGRLRRLEYERSCGMGGEGVARDARMAKRHSLCPRSGLMIIGRRIGRFALNDGESDVGHVGQV